MEYIKHKQIAKPTPNNTIFLILAGGQSKRMGRPKALLEYKNKTFIQNIYEICSNFSLETYISLANNTQLKYLENININEPNIIYDDMQELGPICPIYTCFKKLNVDNIFLLSVDIPKINKEQIRYLYSFLNEHKNTSIISKAYNLDQPCFSIYNKSCIPYLEKALKCKDYKLKNLINIIPKVKVNFMDTLFKDNLFNINTISDYQSLLGPFVFSVSGFKNSYKTTLISKLIPYFKKDNYKFSIIKHDGHHYNEFKNTDTYKYYESGAEEYIIFSHDFNNNNAYENKNVDYTTIDKYTHTKLGIFNINKYIKYNSCLDFIIIEGLKNDIYPKILITSDQINPQQYEHIQNSFLTINKNQVVDENISNIYKSIIKERNARFF